MLHLSDMYFQFTPIFFFQFTQIIASNLYIYPMVRTVMGTSDANLSFHDLFVRSSNLLTHRVRRVGPFSNFLFLDLGHG